MRDRDGLLETDPVGKKRSRARPAAVNKRFWAFDPHQVLPPSLDDWLSEDDLAAGQDPAAAAGCRQDARDRSHR